MAAKKIRILHFSSRYEECGVAKYLEQYIRAMADSPEVENEYFGVSPYETPAMSPADLQKMAHTLQKELKDYDILHVQHEFSIYGRDSLRRIVEAGKAAHKKVIVTAHISPSLAAPEVKLPGLGLRSWLHFVRAKLRMRRFLHRQIKPFRMADMVIVHNDFTANSLKHFGVHPDRIQRIIFPVQVYEKPPKTDIIAKQLHKKPGDVVYCAVGFIHRYKGLADAVKALKFLPENYKFAILGGMKGDSDHVEFYNKLCDLIDSLGLQKRVYISGYVQSDDELNGLMRECDVCVYPYDKVYYSNVSSSSLNLAFANTMPVIVYPTNTFKEIAELSDGAAIVCETFAYYELARELQRVDLAKQRKLSGVYAEKMAWPKQSGELIDFYKKVVNM